MQYTKHFNKKEQQQKTPQRTAYIGNLLRSFLAPNIYHMYLTKMEAYLMTIFYLLRKPFAYLNPNIVIAVAIADDCGRFRKKNVREIFSKYPNFDLLRWKCIDKI